MLNDTTPTQQLPDATVNPVPSGKVCSKCGQPGEFRVGHRQCKKCERAYRRELHSKNVEQNVAYREARREHYRKLNVTTQKRRKIERHAAIDQIKSVPCAECRGSFPPYVMDFDHREPVDKKHEISFLLNKTSCPWQRILDEVAKCDVVCVRCHRLRTWVPSQKPLDNRCKLIIQLKAVPCVDCGKSFHYYQMDFDHVRGKKVREVPLLKNRAAILIEAAKCDVVCANCHRERSHTAAKGAQRLDPRTVDMTWQRRIQGTPQGIVVPPEKRKIPAFRFWHALAGTLPDRQVAEIAGVTPSNVTMFRQKQSIPSFRQSKMKTELAHA